LKLILSQLTVRQFLIGSFLFLSAYLVANRNWLNTRFPIQMDANGYYVYLPAIFIFDDLEKLDFINKMPEQFDRKYFLYPGAHGGYMTKYTPGMAILELPFFLAGHFAAPVFNFEQSGYSAPYRLAIAISSLFYSCLGLWILSIVLARYFKKETVLSIVILLLLATNLLFYSVIQAATTHNYVFFVLCLLLYFADKWYSSGKWQDFAYAGACVGFGALIRPTEILVGFIPAGMFLQMFLSQKSRLEWLKGQFISILTFILCFAVFLSPVFIYWKFATGNWVAYTYGHEGFYFDRPSQIWYGLFGFRKGWFIYTPILFLALSGIIMMWKQPRFSGIKAALLWYMPVNIYIVLSWYGWWYGGCFGLRAMVPALAIMAFPLAVFFERIIRTKVLFYSTSLFFIFLNVFQSFQYQRQILHMDSMTWRSYIYVFGKWKLTKEEIAKRETLLDHPDYNQRGKKLDEYFK